eukprot:403351025
MQFRGKIKRMVRSVDMYGAPINLMYKSKDTYQTFLGGFFTIITRLAVLLYFILGLTDIYNKQGTIVKKTLYRDPLKEDILIDVDQQKFDIGITFSVNDSSQDVSDNIYRYFQIKVRNFSVNYDSQGVQERTEDAFQLSSCTKNRFGGDQTIAEQMHTSALLCPDNLKFQLAGSLTGNFSTFSIVITPCDNEILQEQNKNFTCAEKSEIENVFDKTTIKVLVMTSYFDPDEFKQNPIKYSYQNFEYPLSYSMGVSQQFKLQNNFLETQDSWFGSMIGKIEYSYLELVSGSQSYFQAKEGGNPQFSIQFYTSSNEDHLNRSVKTFMNCISLTGGLSSVIALIAKLTIVKFQKKYLHQSIIKKLFKIQKELKSLHSDQNIKGRKDQVQKSSLLQDNSVDEQNYLRLENKNNKYQVKKIKIQKNQLSSYQSILQSRVKAQLNYVGIIAKQTIQNWMRCGSRIQKEFSNQEILVKNATHMLYQQFDIVKVLKSSQKSGLLMKLNLNKNQQLLSEYTKDILIPAELIKHDSKDIQGVNMKLKTLENDAQLFKALTYILEKSKKEKLSQNLLNELLSDESKKMESPNITLSDSPSKSSKFSGKEKSSLGKESHQFKKVKTIIQKKQSKDKIILDKILSDDPSTLKKSQEHLIGLKTKKLNSQSESIEKDLTSPKKNNR